jgi:hypothetical protein
MRHIAQVVTRAGALVVVFACLLGTTAVRAQVAMPDATQMSGIPLPAPELTTGSLSVRVVRERMGNNIAGQSVSVTSNGTTKTATTDAQGRAEFSGFTPGATVVATAEVDGEILVSQEFPLPARGGVRVALVAGATAAAAKERQSAEAAAKEPARQGIVVIGGESRLVFEFQSDVLTGFYILEIVNNARTPIDPGEPLDIPLPDDVTSPTLMQGSSRQATLRGNTIRITGPFAPGKTDVQVGFSIADHGTTYTLNQKWPAAFEQVFVAAEKIGDMSVESAQLPKIETINAEGGKMFVLASGGRLAAGDTLTVTLQNLPAHNRIPRYVAVGLGALILLAGLFFAFTPGKTERATLEEERARLMRELVAIEERRRAGRPKARDGERRPLLTAELERVLATLDEAPGGGQGAAA